MKYGCASTEEDFIKINPLHGVCTDPTVIVVQANMIDESNGNIIHKTTIHLSMTDAAKFAREILDMCTDELLEVDNG